MPVFLSTIFSILGNLPNVLGDYFKQKHELEKIRVETEKKIELERQKLAAELARADYERAKASLAATGRYFKYFTFVMWFGPFMIGLVAPNWSKAIFDNLGQMPEWYVQSVVLIMFTIWGISSSAPVVVSIFSGMQEFFKGRREYKLAKLDRKTVFDGIRAIQGRLSEKEVKAYDKLIDKLEGK